DVNNLSLGRGGRAGRRELRRLLDLDEAHAAHARHRKAGVIAIVRYEDSGVLRRLEDRGAGRNGDLAPLDRQRDHVRVCHYATAGTRKCFFFLIRASKSARNFLMPDETGVAHESLSTQIVLPVMLSPISKPGSGSSGVPSPATMRSTILVVHAVPSRHCVHWAQPSCAKKRAARAICFTRFCWSSMTITPPE